MKLFATLLLGDVTVAQVLLDASKAQLSRPWCNRPRATSSSAAAPKRLQKRILLHLRPPRSFRGNHEGSPWLFAHFWSSLFKAKAVLQLVPMTDAKDQLARDNLEKYLVSKALDSFHFLSFLFISLKISFNTSFNMQHVKLLNCLVNRIGLVSCGLAIETCISSRRRSSRRAAFKSWCRRRVSWPRSPRGAEWRRGPSRWPNAPERWP